MMIRILPLVVVFLIAPPHARAQDRLPIIDMHLHAMAADQQGPPPVGMCAPFERYPVWDPAQPFDSVFMAMLKEPPCDEPVWSPLTDEEVMNQTIAAMERWNIVVGVLSESPDRFATWHAAAPERFIPGIVFDPMRNSEITPDSLRRLIEIGNVAVLGEITSQYAGIPPGDESMAPYWALAEELDIPVGIHIGAGPPGVGAFAGRYNHNYRAQLSSALTLEDVCWFDTRTSAFVSCMPATRCSMTSSPCSMSILKCTST